MSQDIQDRNWGWQRTIHGIGHLEETNGGSWEPKFVAIGARVGRSGQIFEANDRADVVVKLFTWAAGLPAEVVRKFTRDVIRVADLHHPNVAQVFDAGMLGDGTPFVVMERLAGMTLDEATSGRSLPMVEVLPILRGVGAALSAAHGEGVAHGQVRADNVFVTNDGTHATGRSKLLDFGVAGLATGAQDISRGAHALGPRAAERADQRALATLAWRLLGPMSSPAIHRVLMRAMSPDPSQRFGSVDALVEALEAESVSTAAPRSAPNAGAVKTLAGGVIRISPSRLAVAVVAPPTGLAAAAAHLPTAAAPPVLTGQPSSLTQQFFAEGERLDMEHAARDTSTAKAATQEDAEEEEEGQLEAVATARVPRSRAQMTAAALLALGSVALIGWTVVSLASKPDGSPHAADTSPATVVVRPAVSPTAPPRPVGPTTRGPAGKPVRSRPAPAVQPPPFAAPQRPSVTASEAPAPAGPTAVQRAESPGAPTEATPSALGGTPGQPPPGAAPMADTNAGTEIDDRAGDEARASESAGSTPGATTVAPPASDDVSPSPSAPAAPAPSEAAPPPTTP